MSLENGKKRFCTYCGNPVGMKASFCRNCGKNIGKKIVDVEKPAASSQTASQNSKKAAKAKNRQAINTGAKAVAVAQSLQAVPWKVVVGDQLPQNPFPELIRTAGAVGARLSGSLGGPAFSLFLATLIEASAAVYTSNSLATRDIYIKITLSILILAFGLIARDKKGLTSKLVMLSTLALSLVQANTLLGGLQVLISNPSFFASYLPNGLTQAIALTAAINTFRKSLR